MHWTVCAQILAILGLLLALQVNGECKLPILGVSPHAAKAWCRTSCTLFQLLHLRLAVTAAHLAQDTGNCKHCPACVHTLGLCKPCQALRVGTKTPADNKNGGLSAALLAIHAMCSYADGCLIIGD
eukprot:GHRR01036380.1.p1 GENE.GHRR01036380.1~~GHRR01036380.1.p1  ORF type:complete len:126 (+),score=22.07 GHRR01036380.1:34-411(+)